MLMGSQLGKSSRRLLRSSAALAVAIGSFFLGFHEGRGTGLQYPYATSLSIVGLGLAAVAILVALVTPIRLIGPASLVIAALLVLIARGVLTVPAFPEAFASVAAVVLGLLLLANIPQNAVEHRAIGITRRELIKRGSFAQRRVVVIFGAVLLDATQTSHNVNAEVNITAVCGTVALDVPSHWNLRLTTGSPLVSLRERGVPRNGPGDPALRIRVRGALGVVELRRR
jgi:hypothetical protein